jgi:hypothetical protein
MSMTTFSPRGWKPGLIEHRFVDATTTPLSYDAERRSVDAVISTGAPVPRFYGTEVLRIAPSAVIIDRLVAGGIPVLDSHQQIGIGNALGRVTKIWFSGGALMGKLAFNATPEGRKAEGMVQRGEITGISAGYRVEEWQISDENGDIIDPEKSRLRWDDTDNLTYEAVVWELIECSLVTTPADTAATIRSLGGDHDHALPAFTRIDDPLVREIKVRMAARQAIASRRRYR